MRRSEPKERQYFKLEQPKKNKEKDNVRMKYRQRTRKVHKRKQNVD